MKLQKILFLIDPDHENTQALARVVDLAKKANASVEVFTCGYTPVIETVIVFENGLWEQTEKAFIEYQKQRLQEWVKPFQDQISIQTSVAWEVIVAEGMLKKAKESQPDLVIIDGLVHSDYLPHWLSHHVQWELIKYLELPLLILRRQQLTAQAPILAAIDPLTEETHAVQKKSVAKHPISSQILQKAKYFSQLYQAQFISVHAYQRYSAFYALAHKDMQKYVAEVNRLHHQSVLALLQEQGFDERKVEFLEDAASAAQALLEKTNDSQAQMLVLGASQKHGLEKWLEDSVAQKVIAHAGCDLLIVH